MKSSELREYSPLTWSFERTFHVLQLLSIATWMLGSRVGNQQQFTHGVDTIPATKRRGRRIEAYVVGWFVAELLMLWLATSTQSAIRTLLTVAASYRLLDILQATLNLNVFDRLRIDVAHIYVATLARTALLSVWNFFESILCFSVIYATHHVLLQGVGDAHLLPTVLYFSTVTQLTVGYGDVTPTGMLRAVVMMQGALGFVLAVFAISRVIAFLPKTRSVFGDD